MSPRISPSRISNERSLTATRPPNCLRALAQRAAAGRPRACACARRQRRRSGTGGGARRGRSRAIHGHTPSRANCSSSTIRMPNTTSSKLPCRPSSPGSRSCSSLLQERDQRRAQHRAPHAAGAADHGHEQVLDALVDAERRRVHEPLQVRVQPSRDAREQRGVDERDDLQARGVDAERLDHVEPALAARGSRGPGASRAGCAVAHSAASASAQMR